MINGNRFSNSQIKTSLRSGINKSKDIQVQTSGLSINVICGWCWEFNGCAGQADAAKLECTACGKFRQGQQTDQTEPWSWHCLTSGCNCLLGVNCPFLHRLSWLLKRSGEVQWPVILLCPAYSWHVPQFVIIQLLSLSLTAEVGGETRAWGRLISFFKVKNEC